MNLILVKEGEVLERILEIDIDSPVFKTMLADLNKEIKRVIEKVHEGSFESGEISLKLSLSQIEDHKEYPKMDDLGFEESEIYCYKKPHFKHTVSTTLKKQYKEDGIYSEDRELKKIDDKYVLVPVQDPQMNLLDDDKFLK